VEPINRYLIEMDGNSLISYIVNGVGSHIQFDVVLNNGEKKYAYKKKEAWIEYWHWWEDATSVTTEPVDICILYSQSIKAWGSDFVSCGIAEVKAGKFSVAQKSAWTREELDTYLAQSEGCRRIRSVDSKKHLLQMEGLEPMIINILGYEGTLFGNVDESALSGAGKAGINSENDGSPKKIPRMEKPKKPKHPDTPAVEPDNPGTVTSADSSPHTATGKQEKAPLDVPSGKDMQDYFCAENERMIAKQGMK